MTGSKFTQSEYLQRMIDYTLHQDDYSRLTVMSDGNYYEHYRRTDVLIPLGTKQYSGDNREWSYFGPAMFHWAFKNAEFLRWSVIDESIPLQDKKRIFGLFDGCRRSNTIALSMLRYWPALPELREAMLHERDRYLRQLCVEAIGVMGSKALPFAKDIRRSITKYNDDSYYQLDAVEALENLGDTSAVPLLLELYETTRDKIDRLTFDEAMKKEQGSMILIDKITSALIKLDPQSAREIMAKELTNPSPHVHHHAKLAFELSPLRYELKLMRLSNTALASHLPKNPTWMFGRRQNI